MKYLLDTCVLSEFVKQRPNPALRRWLGEQSEDSLYLSVLSLGELEKGVAKAVDSRRQERLARWLEEDVVHRFERRLLPIGSNIATCWGRWSGQAERAGRKRPAIDALLAATAHVHGATLVTRNVKDFAGLDIEVLNPWTS